MAEVALALKICLVVASICWAGLNRRETDAKQDKNKQHELSMFFSDHAVEVLLNSLLFLGFGEGESINHRFDSADEIWR